MLLRSVSYLRFVALLSILFIFRILVRRIRKTDL